MQPVADDPVNRCIWTQSAAFQRKIALPLQVGAQQAMPKACDEAKFSPESPLPWMPDLVGSRFGSGHNSVLVVASSYNGFIEGYSERDAVMPLCDYVNAKNDDNNGLERFVRSYVGHVVEQDEDYYQPILRDLLSASGCALENCCLTDLCKASFVQRGEGPDGGNRGDKGDDSVVRNYWQKWIPYLVGVAEDEGVTPLPYQWLWQRMQQCRVIVALGTIAEYGVLKIFQLMAKEPNVWSWKDNAVTPDHPTMNADVSNWEYAYASSKRKLRDWLSNEDWWVLSDADSESRWFMLPVYHPSSAIGRGNDRRYLITLPRVRRMIEEAIKKL